MYFQIIFFSDFVFSDPVFSNLLFSRYMSFQTVSFQTLSLQTIPILVGRNIFSADKHTESADTLYADTQNSLAGGCMLLLYFGSVTFSKRSGEFI